MNSLSVKEYLSLKMPTEEASVSDHSRILLALQTLGYEHVTIPLHVLRKLYPMCRNANFDITVTLVHTEHDWILTQVEAGDQRHYHYGLAVDYGSTTIVMQLVDLNGGAVLAQAKAENGQVAFGTDILTRITYCMEHPDHAAALQRATVETFHHLFAQLTKATGIEASQCPIMVMSGNTTMVHFLLGLDAWTVFAAPFAPVTTDPGFLWGHALNMDFAGLIYVVPAASNYVGGDIVSGLLVLGLHKQKETNLFFDIGTNGELVIGNDQWLIAGAGAAGPALEGYISRFGTRAMPGAIDSVTISGSELTFTTIGGEKPIGICGSGIIDLMAHMRLNGWINIAGELNPSASERIIYLPDEEQYAAVYAYAEESASGLPLYFSQTDITRYLDTKSAAYTMIECLLESAGISQAELTHCYLSGAFPAHSDLEAAITIGIFPDLPRNKYIALTNSSLDGARKILLDHAQLAEAKILLERLYCIQFASIPDFIVRMQAAKFIPHTDLHRFPTVAQKLSLL